VRRIALLPIVLASLAAAAPAGAGSDPDPVFADGFESGTTGFWGDLTELTDDFEDGALTGWSIVNPEDAAVEETGGQLRLEPELLTVWFNTASSILVHRTVAGNFRVSARVTTRRATAPDDPPLTMYRLGGLAARDPDDTQENYVFVVVGADDADLSAEAKTTVDSSSTFEGPAWAGGEAELRICRLGEVFHLLVRPTGGGSWQQPWSAALDSPSRPDLPPILQVGAVAYNNSSPADLSVRFDSIDFRRPVTLADCLEE